MKVYLAGYETSYRLYKCDLPKDYNLFLTYFYRRYTEPSLTFLKESKHTGLITIDSGAHSFFEKTGNSVMNSGKTKFHELPDPDKYFSEYTGFLQQWQGYFDYFCELDIQELYGQAKIDTWRQTLTRLGLGKKMITVHHSVNTWKEFEKLCEESESKYIAIEGIRKGRACIPYNKHLKYAYEKGVRVHGFAFTRTALLHEHPFYSVDSSSWTTAHRYGCINLFEDNRMKNVKPTKELFVKHKIPMELNNRATDKLSCKKKLEFCATQYVKLQDYFTTLWETRGIHWSKYEGNLPTN